jgi:hypothetical protein
MHRATIGLGPALAGLVGSWAAMRAFLDEVLK